MTPLHLSGGYIETQPGTLNVILCAPHGGRLRPASIPNRDAGGFINGRETYDHSVPVKDFDRLPARVKGDMYTVEISILVADELKLLTGKRPHIVINQLHRTKMDGNAHREKATFNVPEAQLTWDAFHNCIGEAKQSFGGKPGLFIDMHGHMHPENWIELGYTLKDHVLDSGTYCAADTSIYNLSKSKGISVHELINGPNSFGSLLLAKGYKVVPSPEYPSPRGGKYYPGGYNTVTHGSMHGGCIDAIQIETPRVFRQKHTAVAYAKDLAMCIYTYLQMYYSSSL